MMDGMDEGHPTFDGPEEDAPDPQRFGCDHAWRVHRHQGYALWVECRHCGQTPFEALERRLVLRP